MSIKITKVSLPKTDANCHLLPCNIQSNGKAKVSAYFEPCIRESQSESSVKEASFRGTPLLGKDIQVPEGYTGALIRDEESGDNGGIRENKSDKKMKLSGTFKQFTYWNWDVTPSTNDTILQAMDWIALSDTIHAPPSADV